MSLKLLKKINLTFSHKKTKLSIKFKKFLLKVKNLFEFAVTKIFMSRQVNLSPKKKKINIFGEKYVLKITIHSIRVCCD